MAESLHWVTGMIVAFMGIALTLLGVGWNAFYQGKALEKPEEQIKIGKKLRRCSWAWTVAGFIYIGIVLYILIRLRA